MKITMLYLKIRNEQQSYMTLTGINTYKVYVAFFANDDEKNK